MRIFLTIIFEALFLTLIGDVIGLYTRYYFLRLIGKRRTLAYLSGEEADDPTNTMSHRAVNLCLGVLVVGIILTISFLIYEYFIFDGW